MPRPRITRKDTKEGPDPYVKRRYEILAYISAIENNELSNVVTFLSDKLSIVKHNMYGYIDKLIKEGRLTKKEQGGKTILKITDKTIEELIDRAFLIFDTKTKEILRSCLDKKILQDEAALKFFKDMIPKLTDYLLDLLKNNIPEGLIPIELRETLKEELMKFYTDAWVKSQLF